ncbi:MAG TPA: [protein-PII] uridylyltransferase [Lacipirellula sp.]
MTAGSDSAAALPLSEAVRAAREELKAGRERIREMHDRGLDGLQVCGRLTSLVDGIVGKLFDAAAADIDPAGSDKLRTRIALVALGGYGRRHSAPYSDVDLMLLYGSDRADQLTPLVRKFTNAMFDAGFQLGSSLRTAEEAVALARGDGVICSSLIDNRLVAGSQPLHERFRGLFEKMIRKRSKAVCRAFGQAREEERHQYGESIYLLEPHVKRSRGGLRDLHLLRWMGFAELGESDPERQFHVGAISKFDHHRLQKAQAFLLRLRNEMHFHSDGAKDLLDRAEQLRVSALMGYRGGEGMLPVERFMRDYFRHTNHIWQMARRREAAIDAVTRMSRILDPVVSRKVEGDYRIGVRQISATRTGLAKLEGNLEQVLRIVELSVSESKPLDHATSSALVLLAPECSEELTPAVAQRFLYLIASPMLAGRSLRLLHELGYLERIIPPVKHARCLLQFNQYHKYTVDEHSLQAVERVAEFAARNDALGEAYRGITDKTRLHLALLLHDLGKGFEEDHSEVGRRIAEESSRRLLLSPSAADDVTMLVHQHLSMAHLAFRRDTSDPEVVERFAELVGSGDRLRMLFVLSCADLAAVGPDVLTQWKVDVLTELYRKTLASLGDKPMQEDGHTQRRIEALGKLTAAERDDGWFARQVDSLPDAYVAARSTQQIADALRRFRKLPSRGADAWGQYNREAQTVEFTVGVDQGRGRGAFSSSAGVLSSKGFEILGADAQVLADGLLFLRFVAIDADTSGEPSAARLEEIARELIAAVDSAKPPRFRRIWGEESAQASRKLTGLPNDVRIDNASSRDATVVEVYTFDRTGLLYRLARKLHELELTIWHAKIGTNVDQVVDVFYVTNRGGGKVEDPERLEYVRRHMLEVIDAPNA